MGNTCKDTRNVDSRCVRSSPVTRRRSTIVNTTGPLSNYWHNDKIIEEPSDKENIKRVINELGI